MASLATLKINSYINIMMMVLIFAIFMLLVGTIIQVFVLGGWSLSFQVFFVIVVTILAVLFQLAISSSVVQWSTGTRILQKGENAFLEEIVGRLAKQADIPMPRLGIVESDIPNAFVFGLTPASWSGSIKRRWKRSSATR
jgi:heat shock protein HtpX